MPGVSPALLLLLPLVLLMPEGATPTVTAAAPAVATTTATAATDDAAPVVVIDGEALSRGSYKEFLLREFGSGAVEPFVMDAIIARRAAERQITLSDAELEAWIEVAIKLISERPDLQGADMNEIRKKYRSSLGRSFALIDKLGRDWRASPSGIEQEYDERHGERRRMRHILLRAEDASTEESARKRADEILAKLKGGEDFGKLAEKESQDPGSAENGGELPALNRSSLVPEFADVGFKLKEGELSSVVKTRYGYHIIRLEKIEPPGKVLDDALRAELRKEIDGRPFGPEEFAAFQARLRSEAKVSDEKASGDPVAVLDGKPLSRAAFGEFLFRTYGSSFLDAFIDNTLVMRRAKKDGVVPGAEEVAAWLDRRLAESGAGEAEAVRIREERQSSARWFCTLEALVRARRESEPGIAREYELRFGARCRARQLIVRATPEGGGDEAAFAAAKKRADELHAMLGKGAELLPLAKSEAEKADSLVSGGELPEFGRLDVSADFADVAFKLKEGETSAPTRAEFGWYIVQVVKVTPAAKPLDDQVKGDLKKEAAARAPDERERDDLLKDLRKSAKIERKLE